MNKLIFSLLMLLGTVIEAQITTPAASPFCKIEQKLGLGTVTIEYSRPSVKNRKIFGELVPFGKLWRTGANRSTVITFSENLSFGGKPVNKGSYSLFATPGEDSWEVILYNETNIGGTPQNFDATKVVSSVKVKPEELLSVVETFTIDINDITSNSSKLIISWENTQVSIDITTNVDEVVMKNIEKVMAGPSSDDYYNAAKYYYDNNKDMNVALGWIQKSTSMDAKYWKLRIESLILGRLGKIAEAIAAAEKSSELAKAAGNDDFVRMNNEAISEWKK
ncbi:MAG: DUF2911 domain-containing protein [Saprospiraceae bacterium]|nr:DUF2911 domain-containing protein [Saprospiraceae bacterium]